MSNVSVPVTNDDIVEGTEEFDLMLTVPPSLGPAITAGGRNTAVGIITDSTSKCNVNYYSLIMHNHLKLVRTCGIISISVLESQC